MKTRKKKPLTTFVDREGNEDRGNLPEIEQALMLRKKLNRIYANPLPSPRLPAAELTATFARWQKYPSHDGSLIAFLFGALGNVISTSDLKTGVEIADAAHRAVAYGHDEWQRMQPCKGCPVIE